MKAAAFDYCAPHSFREAATILANNPDAKILAGGQTLGPMLNLRLSQPSLLVDISRIAEAKAVTETVDSVCYGACVTHANFEDGRVPDPTGGFLRRVARGIAYRAVRTRGTIGGSLAHADPAADWLTALSALDVEIELQGHNHDRRLALSHFIKGALTTDLSDGEVLARISLARPNDGSRFGYAKLWRKTGEFAQAIGAVRRTQAAVRLVLGASGGAPIVIDDAGDFIEERRILADRLGDHLARQGVADGPYERAIYIAALQRALEESWKE